jgi:hypothetical protein
MPVQQERGQIGCAASSSASDHVAILNKQFV